jgi:hypothetical protein
MRPAAGADDNERLMRTVQDDIGIELVIDETKVLRTGGRGLTEARQRFQEEARAQMRERGVTAFPASEAVSVQLELHLPDIGNPVQMPAVVKGHLDALKGVTYNDDRQIEHIVVHRRALDHPYMRGFQPDDPRSDASVFVHVQRLERYTNSYDRAFRAHWFRREAHSPFRPEWTVKDEVELRKLRNELDRRQETGADDPLVELVRTDEESKLRDGFFADIDRPGPLAPGARAVHRLLDLPRMHQFLRRRHGATLLVDLPGQESGSSAPWKQQVQRAMSRFAARRAGLPFRGHVSLDIAVRGQSIHGKDLDNLVHGLLVPFEDQLCSARGTVVSYRVYQAVGEPGGVLVRVLDDTRLLGLQIAIAAAAARPGPLSRVEDLIGSRTT